MHAMTVLADQTYQRYSASRMLTGAAHRSEGYAALANSAQSAKVSEDPTF